MRVNLVFGFLGSGKTTLLRRLLASPGPRTAVIVNEFGDVGIDGRILEGANVDMVELTSGCLCCTLKGSLLNAIEELERRAAVERVIVEATGVAHPEELLETFADPSLAIEVELGPLVTVVDAAKYPKIRGMLGEFYTSQVEHADVVVLNKTDLASAAALDEVREELEDLNPDAAIVLTERCDVEPRLVLEGAARADAPDADGHPHHHHRHGHAPADSLVLDASGDHDRVALERFFATLPEAVWRAKGFVVVAGAPSLVQYATGELEITPAEPRAHAHLVFIGGELDRAALAAGLAACAGPAAGAP